MVTADAKLLQENCDQKTYEVFIDAPWKPHGSLLKIDNGLSILNGSLRLQIDFGRLSARRDR